MTPIEFDQALDRWGGDLESWPPDEAARARNYLVGHPEALRNLRAAGELDDFLTGLHTHRAPGHLAARIIASVPRPDALDLALTWLTERLWRPAMLALILTVAGYLAGAALPELEPVDPALAEDVMALAFQDIYAELDDAQ